MFWVGGLGLRFWGLGLRLGRVSGFGRKASRHIGHCRQGQGELPKQAFHGPHAAPSIGGKPVAAPGPLSYATHEHSVVEELALLSPKGSRESRAMKPRDACERPNHRRGRLERKAHG